MGRLQAGIRRREDGTLEKHFNIGARSYTVTGRDQQELTAAEQQLRQRLQESEAAQGGSDPTLDQYFGIWILRKETEDKESTTYRYRKQYRASLSPFLGHKKLSELSQADVFSLQQQLVCRLHPKTVNYLIRLLRSILDDAVTEEIIRQNPAASVRMLRYVKTPTEETAHRALTETEQAVFMQAARKNFYYEFFAFLLLTGMRYGEAAALTWGDIDEEKNVIRITRSLTFDRHGHVVEGSAKTRAGIREVPLTDKIRRILTQQMQKLESRVGLSAEEASAPEQRIFCSAWGRVLHNRTANQNLQRILQELEAEGIHIDHFTLHAFRDTFATRFIEQGGNPQTLKTLLGHSRLSVTMDLYSQVLPNTRQQEMERIDIEI